MAQTIIIQDTPVGPRWSYGTIGFISPDGMAGLGDHRLRDALTSIAERDQQVVLETLPDRLAQVRQRLFGSAAFGAANDAIDAARRSKSDTLAADARLLEPARAVDPAFVLYHRNAVGAMDPAGQARWIDANGDDLERLTSIAAHGTNHANLSGRLWDEALEKYRLANWKARFTGAGGHPAQPNVNEILAVGPDMAAIQDEAEEHLREHIERLAGIGAMEATAKELIALLSAFFAITPAKVLDRALGRTDAIAA